MQRHWTLPLAVALSLISMWGQIPTPGGSGSGSGTPAFSSVDVFDPATLAAESLTNGALTAGTSWTQTGDMALAANAATYTHSSAAGTLQQASGTLAIAGVASRRYRFVYTVSAITAGVSCNITTAFALAATALTLTAGAQTTDFVSAASPGNFVISCTSTAGAITLDTLSLKEIVGGNIIVAGSVKATGYISSGVKFTATGCSLTTTVGGATAGTVVSGTTGACTIVITMNGATGLTAPNGWACSASDRTTPANLISQSASTATTATITGTTVSGDVLSFSCVGY